ncbi:MAG TPA: cobalamin-dependent protein, partial [Pelovirga sp.]|nr:cobalamin-dependent protein [Pelovirga sp.]
MRILLINPPNCGRSIPEERYGITSIKKIFRSEPLALEALAGNLYDHEVRIVDLKVEPDALESALVSFAPDLVGFTAVTCEAQTVLKMATTVKELSAAMVVVGGVHASCQPEFFNQSQVDFVVVGLGKLSLRELVKELEKGNQQPQIPGIAKTNPGGSLPLIPRIYSNADLADQVPPRYDLVDHYRPHYTLENLNIPLGLVSSAVGCPYDCHFCCISPITGGHYLTADIDSVIRDIKLLDTVPVIRLVDANSFGNPVAAL